MLRNFNIEKNALRIPIILVLLMWLGFILQNLGFFSNCYGAIIPLVPQGLKGIVLSPFLHGGLEHLIGNTIPIAALSFLLFQFYSKVAPKVLIWGTLMTGLLVWSLPPIDIFTGESYLTCVIGASGVVYVLAFFLFFSGIFRWDLRLLAVSLAVGFYYGSLVWGVFPEDYFYTLPERSRISWQSHLAGAIVGVILAYHFRKKGTTRKKYLWEFPNYYNEKDDRLWQEYKEKNPQDFEELPSKKKDEIWERLEELRKKSRGENENTKE